jgi:spore coat protein U-like protein
MLKNIHRVYILLICLFLAFCMPEYACARCVIGTQNGVIAFGTIQPSGTSTVFGTVTTNITFGCSNGRAYTVTASPASGWTLASGTNTMAYTPVFITSGTGQGTGTLISLLTAGASYILPAAYQNAPAGNYTDSALVTFTINCPTCSAPNTVYGYLQATTGVTATIASTCTVNAAGAMSFTISDPSAAGPIAATVATNASIFCTKNSSYTVTAVSGNAGGSAAACSTGITGTLKDSSGDTMSYTFTCGANSTGSGFGSGNFKSLGIGGSIASAAYINAPVSSSYADTITITISY